MLLARSPILLLLLAAACGGSSVQRTTLPENVGADPRGLVGIIAPAPTTALPTALRALGVPYRLLAASQLDGPMLDGLSLVVIDEGALDDLAVAQALPRLLDDTRTSRQSLVILAQSNERGIEVLRRNAAPFEPRPITHGVSLASPPPAHRTVRTPNVIRGADLAALSERTTQFARGRNARAIIAGNLERPDSSAALLRVVYGKGAIYYAAFALTAAAADGQPAEQRMLANLVSLGPGD
jgi:hypothetical protein